MTSFKVTNSFRRQLEFAPGAWVGLMKDLQQRSGGCRESGAFLLADRTRGDRVIRSWLPYDTLAPESLAHDYVRLESSAFSRLWRWCEETGTEVVADVHTHPGGPRQSRSDRTYPMVALPGHIALIVPSFAARSPQPIDCSFNIYLGDQRWRSYLRRGADRHIVAP